MKETTLAAHRGDWLTGAYSQTAQEMRMKKHKKRSHKGQLNEKLEILMQELETRVDPDSSSTGAWTCRRFYCTP